MSSSELDKRRRHLRNLLVMALADGSLGEREVNLVADRCAATPTMAGEMVTPVLTELRELLETAVARLARETRVRLDAERQRLDHFGLRGASLLGDRLRRERRGLEELSRRLAAVHPAARVTRSDARGLRTGCNRIYIQTVQRY